MDSALLTNPVIILLMPALLPPLIAAIVGFAYPDNTKLVIALAVSVVLGILAAWLVDVSSRADAAAVVAIVVSMGQGYYHLFRRLGGAGALDWIETNVLPNGPGAGPVIGGRQRDE